MEQLLEERATWFDIVINGSFVNTCMPSMQLTPWPASHSDSTSVSTSDSSFF